MKRVDSGRIFSFPPCSNIDATVLILGSMPGVESLKQQQYYAHPRNLFWKIISQVLEFSEDILYCERVALLLKNNIALWDSVHSCVRNGSMDADINAVLVNDFATFFQHHKKVVKIVFNGQTAGKLFIKHTKGIVLPELEMETAPSTSPAYAAMTFDKKLEIWRSILDNTLDI